MATGGKHLGDGRSFKRLVILKDFLNARTRRREGDRGAVKARERLTKARNVDF